MISKSSLCLSWTSKPERITTCSAYLEHGYQLLNAKNEKCRLVYLVCRRGDEYAHLPLLVHSIGENIFEAHSAYGYGGFSGDLVFSDSDIATLKMFLARSRIAALFIRHSPLLRNHRLLPESEIELNRYTYSCCLAPRESFEEYLALSSQKLRWSARHAIRKGYSIQFSALEETDSREISAFNRIYYDLMMSKGAGRHYLFDEAYIKELACHYRKRCYMASIYDGSGICSGGSIYLAGADGIVNYHLSAATRRSMADQGMELLIMMSLYTFGNKGYHELFLGGGHSLNEDDGLSRFKKKFCTSKSEYFCSKLICDEKLYRLERQRLDLAYPSLFLVADARGF